MQKNTLTAFALVACLAGGIGSGAWAQTPPPPTPPAHHGILSHLFHKPKPTGMAPGMHPGMAPGMHHGMMSGMHHGMTPSGTRGSAMTGGIIGNKNSHVYHLPGDPGALPAAQNRVYFPNEAAAIRAGYHHTGSAHHMSGKKTH